MPNLSQIRVYPIKALDGVELDSVSVCGDGWIAYDRQYALFDEDGEYVNGRQNQLVHELETNIDVESGAVEVGIHGTDEQLTCNLIDIDDNMKFER